MGDQMSENDALRHDVANVLSLVEDQMRELSEMQQKRSALAAKATAAGGTVEVVVDARCVVTGVVIDESYLEDYELVDLGGYVVGAAQGAAREVERLAAAMIAPLTARREEISGLSGGLVGVAGFAEVMSRLRLNPAALLGDEPTPGDGGGGDGGGDSDGDGSGLVVRG
jgi:DNA-binding protein YbaB